jgi:hypothetical protein
LCAGKFYCWLRSRFSPFSADLSTVSKNLPKAGCSRVSIAGAKGNVFT